MGSFTTTEPVQDRWVLSHDDRPIAARAETGEQVIGLDLSDAERYQARLFVRSARPVPESVLAALARGDPLPPRRWVLLACESLDATDASSARIEAHDRLGWHVLPPDDRSRWPIAGAPGSIVSWLVKGRRRGVISRSERGFRLEECDLVDDE